MGPLRKRTVNVNADVATVMNAAQSAMKECGWVIKAMDANSIKADSHVSATSWGETVIIQVQPAGAATSLYVQSKSHWALVDWGKNNRNITQFLNRISQYVPIMA